MNLKFQWHEMNVTNFLRNMIIFITIFKNVHMYDDYIKEIFDVDITFLSLKENLLVQLS